MNQSDLVTIGESAKASIDRILTLRTTRFQDQFLSVRQVLNLRFHLIDPVTGNHDGGLIKNFKETLQSMKV